MKIVHSIWTQNTSESIKKYEMIIFLQAFDVNIIYIERKFIIKKKR